MCPLVVLARQRQGVERPPGPVAASSGDGESEERPGDGQRASDGRGAQAGACGLLLIGMGDG